MPCELWFFDRAKPTKRKDKVLMLDARNIYRKVTRKIYDFSPEQMQNLTAIVWLYRGQQDRFLALLKDYLGSVCAESAKIPAELAAFDGLLKDLRTQFVGLTKATTQCKEITADQQQALTDAVSELVDAEKPYAADRAKLLTSADGFIGQYAKTLPKANDKQHAARAAFELASNEIISATFDRRATSKLVKQLDEARKAAVEQLKLAFYFHRQVVWLQERFPKAELQAVPGLVKLVDRKEIEAADWSLTPGRYVGVAPPEEDEDFDFEQTLHDIHTELVDLNNEAAELAAKIQENFEELGA